MIRAGDRVATVLARDERLIEVFTSISPTFERLRNPSMRKVMARLVTVEQAARIAGVDTAILLERLNAAIAPGGGGGREGEGDRWESEVKGEREALLPSTLASIPGELIVDLDVRSDLRRGEEPFSKIMAARRTVRPGGVLRLRATFEPVPLYAVLGKQGFEHWTEKFADDDWRVWFYAPATTAATAAPGDSAEPGAPPNAAPEPEDDVVIVDVRGLEPPEPMMRTFEALERLPVGKTLLQINVRVPQFLLPQLAERGFSYEIREQTKDLVRIFIRHATDGETAPASGAAGATNHPSQRGE